MLSKNTKVTLVTIVKPWDSLVAFPLGAGEMGIMAGAEDRTGLVLRLLSLVLDFNSQWVPVFMRVDVSPLKPTFFASLIIGLEEGNLFSNDCKSFKEYVTKQAFDPISGYRMAVKGRADLNIIVSDNTNALANVFKIFDRHGAHPCQAESSLSVDVNSGKTFIDLKVSLELFEQAKATLAEMLNELRADGCRLVTTA